jgi:hypothetical protein
MWLICIPFRRPQTVSVNESLEASNSALMSSYKANAEVSPSSAGSPATVLPYGLSDSSDSEAMEVEFVIGALFLSDSRGDDDDDGGYPGLEPGLSLIQNLSESLQEGTGELDLRLCDGEPNFDGTASTHHPWRTSWNSVFNLIVSLRAPLVYARPPVGPIQTVCSDWFVEAILRPRVKKGTRPM